MNLVRVPLKTAPYPVYIGCDVLENSGKLVARHFKGSNIALITHSKLFRLHGKKVFSSLRARGFQVSCVFVPEGEPSKSQKQLACLHDFLARHHYQRDSAVVAVGGGVIGDLAGYCAATYMRGISLFHMPTTVVGQVDSSIGGKTGINHVSAKNLIGAFYHPRAVLCEVRTLETLPRREYVSGLAEVVKYGMVYDKDFLSFLEKKSGAILMRDLRVMTAVVKRCAEIKAEVVGKDEKEKALRMILNYGHTLGHAIETSTEYQSLLHGEAVAWGMVFAAHLSREYAGLSPDVEKQQNELLEEFGLLKPLKKPRDMRRFMKLLLLDKKARKGKVRFILLRDAGKTVVADKVTLSVIRRVMSETLWKNSD